MADTTILRDTAAASGAAVALLSFAYNSKKDYDIKANRQRQLDIAKIRLSILETRSKIEETILSGEPLEVARKNTKDAMDEIWRETNENLDILAEWNNKPVSVIGLSWWRRTFLIYKPIHHPKFLGYGNRIMYWANLFVVGLFVIIALGHVCLL
ncbi:MAG TPA: hypothetical protein VGG97_04460 [Bryobacteraceae bacterium]|jgi:hypothetical protein